MLRNALLFGNPIITLITSHHLSLSLFLGLIAILLVPDARQLPFVFYKKESRAPIEERERELGHSSRDEDLRLSQGFRVER
mmetsp:Transcript_36302/g.41358  ORF Transcript_36302/g.41358 Transcript_36302/m.41358 type:complete len:81 (-) Transcript_36302:339-581(-)